MNTHQIGRLALAAWVGASAGCSPAAVPAEHPANVVQVPQLASSSPAVLAAEPDPPPLPSPPSGYIEAKVEQLVPTGQGSAVLLAPAGSDRVVPIFIGGSEALSIRHRLDHTHYERPLTHDLMDELMRNVGVRLIHVQVDSLKNNTFIGTVVMRHGARNIELDARPSDAIALALGNGAPIYVARRVIEASGVRRDELGPIHGLQVPPAGSPPMP